MANIQVNKVFFVDYNENNERMANVYDHTQKKEMVIQDPNIQLKNKLNMKIGDALFFNSSFHGWVYGRIVGITSAPKDGDVYMIRYYLEDEDDEDEIYLDEVSGNNIEYHL